MSGPRISVVIPVKDDTARLRLCLEALARQTLPPGSFEAVVVDNGSADSPAAMASDFPFAVFAAEEKPGASAARNRGLALSRAPAIAFTDADCLPDPGWLEAGLAGLARYPAGALLAGRIEVVPHPGGRPTGPELFDRVHGFDQRLFVERWGFGATANVLVSRPAAEAVGGFDERIPYYGEDVDFCRRVAAAGWPVAYEPAAVVRHPARPDWASLRGRLERTIRAAVAGRPATLRRLALDLWYDWPPVRTIAASLVQPEGGVKLAAATAAVRLIRARLRIKLFWEQCRKGGA